MNNKNLPKLDDLIPIPGFDGYYVTEDHQVWRITPVKVYNNGAVAIAKDGKRLQKTPKTILAIALKDAKEQK